MFNFVLILPLLVLVPLSLLVIFSYFIFYRSRINRQLNNPANNRHKPLWSPLQVCLTTVIGALVVYAAACLVMTSPNLPPVNFHTPSPNDSAFRLLTQEEMQDGYLSRFSIEENPGYTKEVTEIDSVRYTTFRSQSEADLFHPAFLVYAEYIGSGAPAYQDAVLTYTSPDGEPIGTLAASGMDSDARVICFMGNTFLGGTVSCTVDFYNQLPAEFDLEQLQAENTPLEFVLSPQN